MISGLFALLVVCGVARATPPLVPAADVAEVGLHAWWRSGELVMGLPDREGRPGLRPLDSLVPVVLPDDLHEWAAVGETCVTRPESGGEIDGQRVLAKVRATAQGPVIELLAGDQVLAENALGRPAQVCEVLLVQADKLPGLEVIVAWRMELGPDQPGLRGLTVYRVPETAR
ncbi:MAG: hypothetical protein GXP62_06205 [Oligoflexia bacterium]|nr:hypothetical protein [Oligoflexia bacterium]